MSNAPEISPADWACADWADPIGFGLNDERHGRAYAAMMARTGWTPPVAVDPDLAEAKKIVDDWAKAGLSFWDLAFAGIKRGRALAAAEAKPGLVWVKRGQQDVNPFDKSTLILVKFISGDIGLRYSTVTALWSNVTHYAVITPPAEDVA